MSLLSEVETIVCYASLKDFPVIERTVTELRCTEREYKDVLKAVEVSHKDERTQVEVVEMTIDDLPISP